MRNLRSIRDPSYLSSQSILERLPRNIMPFIRMQRNLKIAATDPNLSIKTHQIETRSKRSSHTKRDCDRENRAAKEKAWRVVVWEEIGNVEVCSTARPEVDDCEGGGAFGARAGNGSGDPGVFYVVHAMIGSKSRSMSRESWRRGRVGRLIRRL